MGEVVEAAVVDDKQKEESSMNHEKYSADVGTIDEKVEAAAVLDKWNEESMSDLQDI